MIVVAGAMLNGVEGAGAPEDVDDKDWVVAWVVEVEAAALGGGGLSPPPPSSVAPKGICIGRNGVTTMPVGEEADAVGWAKLDRVPPQFVAVGALEMPPSNSADEAGAGEVEAIALPEGEQPAFAAVPAIGLRPGEESSEVPRGMPGDATGAAGPIPSGEVVPSGEGAGAPIPCAKTVPQASRTSMTDSMTNRIIIDVPRSITLRFLVKMVRKRSVAS